MRRLVLVAVKLSIGVGPNKKKRNKRNRSHQLTQQTRYVSSWLLQPQDKPEVARRGSGGGDRVDGGHSYSLPSGELR